MRLPRERRIRATAEFSRLRQEGSRLDCGPFLLNFRPSGQPGPARFAVIAAKKNLPQPASWADLAKPVYKGAITMPHPASSGTGYRAPTLAQVAPYLTWVSRSGTSNTWAEGNPDLRPETSTQHSIGVQSSPNHRWAMGVDWWQFKVDDVFGSLSSVEVDRDPELRARYFRNGSYYLPTLNLGQLSKSGLDYNVQYRHPLDKGVFTLGLEGTHNLSSKRSLRSGQDTVSDLGTYQAAFHTVTPRNKLRLSGTIASQQSGWRAAVNYQSGNTEPYSVYVMRPNGAANAGAGNTRRVPHFATLDIGGWYNIHQRLRLVWNIENITNATPPLRTYNNSNTANAGSLYPFSDTRYNDYRGRVFNARLEWQLW